jgi:hypothetical protein
LEGIGQGKKQGVVAFTLQREASAGNGDYSFGKEANNIEGEPLDDGDVQVFRNTEKERVKVIGMRQCDAEKMGIARVTRWRMENK